jgi:hypothetical protein
MNLNYTSQSTADGGEDITLATKVTIRSFCDEQKDFAWSYYISIGNEDNWASAEISSVGFGKLTAWLRNNATMIEIE